MNELYLTINPKIVILQRQGILFTSTLINNQARIQLQALDLIILQNVVKCSHATNAINNILNSSYIQIIAPAITLQMVQEQVNKLTQAGILVTTNSKLAVKNKKKLKLRVIKKHNNFAKIQEYRLSKNFALVPAKNGFRVWSAIKSRFYVIGLEELLIFLAIGNKNNFKSIKKSLWFCKKKIIKTIFNNLINNGLIVKHDSDSVVYQNQLQQNSSSLNTTNNIPAWSLLEADSRLPIYFVPHMENHFPLALGLLYSSIKEYDNGELLKYFNLIPITYFTPEELLNVVYRKFGRGVWLFSNYIWSLDLNLEISKLVKAHNSNNITIHGGPSTPNYQQANRQFMDKYQSIDISVHGEGEVAICEILKSINPVHTAALYHQESLSQVTGVTFRVLEQKQQYTRTLDRVRMNEPNDIPSPYIQGVFDSYRGRVDAAIIESNRGCPFGCTFCDWGSATNQKVRKYDLARTKEEINWIGKNKVKIIWIADANFGMYDRDIELSSYIIKIKEKYGYPQEVVVNYTKNTTWRLAEIIKIFTQGKIISQGIISIQTTDKNTLAIINRKNIKVEKYDELAKVFAKMNLPLSTDLMLGLPGITVAAFNQDLQRYIDLDVSVKAYPTQLLPNSPMADPAYIKKYKIQTDKNDFIISSFSFNEDELQQMKKIYKYYTIADGYSLLRYIMRYLQWEYQIKGIDFLNNLMNTLENNPAKYPILYWTFNYFDTEKCIPGGWDNFYAEVSEFIFDEYKIKPNSAYNTVIQVSKICMPEDTQIYPIKVKLKHDFVKYFKQQNQGQKTIQLSDLTQAKITVSDPNNMIHLDKDEVQYDTHQYFWELDSTIARAKSAS